MAPSHEALIRTLPCWKGAVTISPMNGGLSNLNFRVNDEQGTYAVRLGADLPCHQVYRECELAASYAAADLGLSPRLVYAQPGLTVSDFVEGRCFTTVDLRAQVLRCAALLKRCHTEMGRKVQGRANFFWVFHVLRGYFTALQPVIPAAQLAGWSTVTERLEGLLLPMPICFGHHDLLPGNILDDGARLWLIDWEYGGFGTALFDLANLSSNGAFAEADDSTLLESYFEHAVAEDIIRSFEAMKLVSSLREACWALVSEIHLKVPATDYKSHAKNYLSRYEAGLTVFQQKYGRLKP